MATGKQSQGLMAKIALLFGEPQRASRPSEPASQPAADGDDAAIRKETAKRKQRDDTIRRREFDHLRPIMRKKLNAEHPTAYNGATRPSVFRASTGMDERAETLKKIEFIEAHVVQSWSAMRTAVQAGAKVPAAQATSPAPRSPLITLTEIVPPSVHAPLDSDLDLDFTQIPMTPPTEPGIQSLNAPARADVIEDATESLSSGINSLASVRDDSGLSAIDSDLRDAAILFSDGDLDATQAQLLSPLETGGLETALTDALVSALCDVYRYSGQQEKFNATAMEHAARFGRSPPEWFSLPEILAGNASLRAGTPRALNVGHSVRQWICPAELQGPELAQLDDSDAATEWHLDWSPLQHLQEDAAAPLSRLLTRWCTHPVTMHWRGQLQLLAALEKHTTVRAESASMLWWRIHLNALRVLGLQDEFEDLALSYCTVFEVSPPSWEAARCTLANNIGSAAASADEARNTSTAESADQVRAQHRNFSLVGDLVGEYSKQLETLAGASGWTDHLCVDCRHIGRVDFAAAGSILNLVLQSKASGSTLQFVQVPHLVGVFFKMLGIDRHAQVLGSTH